MTTITPLHNHVLIADLKLPQRTRSGLWLPEASEAHGGTIHSVRYYSLGVVIRRGRTMDPKYHDCPDEGAVVVFCNTAGKGLEGHGERGHTVRKVHAQELLCEVKDYDPNDLTFV